MQILNNSQYLSLILYLVGMGILTLCYRIEYAERLKLKDTTYSWQRLLEKKYGQGFKTLGGSLMTVAGGSMTLGGVILFFAHSQFF